jgi:toxin ParE2
LEIEVAIDYYNSLPIDSETLIRKFYFDLEFAYKSLEINPYFRKRYKEFRCLPLRKFPYLLFIEIDSDAKIVKVISVFNTHQSAEKYP